jgi:hypothetical protein
MPATVGVFRCGTEPPLLMVLTDEPVSAEYLDGRPIPLLDGDCMVGLDMPEDATEIKFRVTVGDESRVCTARWPEPEPEPVPTPTPKRKRVSRQGEGMVRPGRSSRR